MLSSPSSKQCASAEPSKRPSFVIPIGTTSNFVRAIAFKIEAAESNDTSCSPLRPPNKTPTRSFFAIPFIVAHQDVKKSDAEGTRSDRNRRVQAEGAMRCAELKDLLPKRRARQFHCQIRRAVMFIDHGVHFDDLETQHAAMVSENLHRKMRFPVGCAPAHRRSDSRSVLRVNPVHVQRN